MFSWQNIAFCKLCCSRRARAQLPSHFQFPTISARNFWKCDPPSLAQEEWLAFLDLGFYTEAQVMQTLTLSPRKGEWAKLNL